MIQLCAALGRKQGLAPASHCAYPLYALLLHRLEAHRSGLGASLHDSQSPQLCQHVAQRQGQAFWVLNLIEDSLLEPVMQALSQTEPLVLPKSVLQVQRVRQIRQDGAEQLLEKARHATAQALTLQLQTPTMFKQAGRYVTQPTVDLLLQSLWLRWQSCFSEVCDIPRPSLDLLCAQTAIHGQTLEKQVYPLKSNRLYGSVGQITLQTSGDMLWLFHLLLQAAPYFGIGAKTTLGMGGVSVFP